MPMELSDSEGDISSIGLLLHRRGMAVRSPPPLQLFSSPCMNLAQLHCCFNFWGFIIATSKRIKQHRDIKWVWL